MARLLASPLTARATVPWMARQPPAPGRGHPGHGAPGGAGHPRVHLFLDDPDGLALLIGHRWNRVAPTVVYEDLGHLSYEPLQCGGVT